MRYVMEQAALTGHQLRQVPGHPVEIMAEVSQFVVAPGHFGGETTVQSAGRALAHGLLQPPDWPGDIGRQQCGEYETDRRPCEQVEYREPGQARAGGGGGEALPLLLGGLLPGGRPGGSCWCQGGGGRGSS